MPKGFSPIEDSIKAIDARVKGPSSTDPVPCVIQPGQQCTVTVNEYYIPIEQLRSGVSTSNLTAVTTASGKTFTISPGSNILVLSAGFLATTLPARTYVSTAVPNQPLPVLTVNNNSKWRPGAVALLNYMVPRADWYPFGFALSAGPVITFGGASANVSTLGFFVGVSAHFWHRLYLTPGWQLGQFADFPKGFGEGTPIPSNITPTAINRWTWRFAFGITFQTPDFSKIGATNTSTTSTSTPPGQTKTVPNPPTGGK